MYRIMVKRGGVRVASYTFKNEKRARGMLEYLKAFYGAVYAGDSTLEYVTTNTGA